MPLTSDPVRRNDSGNLLGNLLLDQLKLDTPAQALQILARYSGIGNALGHRFYFRNVFLARGLHFWSELEEEPHVSSQ